MSLKSGNKMVTSRNYLGNVSRTKVSRDFNFRTTFDAGYLFPIYAEEVYPSENVSIHCGELVRSITPLGPVMDNSFLDIFFFFVPNRLTWIHWEEFIAGYNKEAWAQDIEYTVPKILFYQDVHGMTSGNQKKVMQSFMDYLPGAFPAGQISSLAGYTESDGQTGYFDKAVAISALFPRAYVKIWNDWFRDENLQDELELYTGDNDERASQFSFNLLDNTKLPKAGKYHNRATSALPQPVKGPDVLIPMQNLQVGTPLDSEGSTLLMGENVGTGSNEWSDVVLDDNPSIKVVANNVSNTIRMLRLATQTELLLARDARGGTRYVESLLSHFGVHNGDARLQRSEYLGSRHIPLSVMQITNTASSSGNPLGSVGGQSVTKDNSHYFSKAFTEHGILFGLAVVRTNISYSDCVRKQFQRFGRFEYIWPEFKHVGDVPLYTKEQYFSQDILDTAGEKVLGYTPYGSELREGFNFNNGLFRHELGSGSLAYLTYQENYGAETPTLSAGWIEQPTAVVSNTLVSDSGPQFYALFSIHEERIIPLDPTSDPGLMDHF